MIIDVGLNELLFKFHRQNRDATNNGRASSIDLPQWGSHLKEKGSVLDIDTLAGWRIELGRGTEAQSRMLQTEKCKSVGLTRSRLRQAVRASQSRPIVERIQRALIRLKASGRYLPQSLLAQAVDYALGQWSTLTVYLDDGRVEIDNNLVENAIRPTAIGKKNWLFVGDADAGERSAIIYTLIESCRRRGLDPYAYLREVLARLPRMTNWQIPEVMPEAWSKSKLLLQRQLAS